MKKFSIFFLFFFASLNAEVINVKFLKNNNLLVDQKIVNVNDINIFYINGYTIDLGELGRTEEFVDISARICKEEVVIAQPLLRVSYNQNISFSIQENNDDTLTLDISVSK